MANSRIAGQPRTMRDFEWSRAEKAIAKAAFEKAYQRECTAIVAEVKKRTEKLAAVKDIWRIHDYLSQQRRETDDKYDYRYSVLPIVFARLIQDKLISEANLQGLSEEKLKVIRGIAAL